MMMLEAVRSVRSLVVIMVLRGETPLKVTLAVVPGAVRTDPPLEMGVVVDNSAKSGVEVHVTKFALTKVIIEQCTSVLTYRCRELGHTGMCRSGKAERQSRDND